MDWNFYAAVFVGFIPPFALLYWIWGKLEGLFNEKKLFFNYFIGWIMGIIIAVFFLILKVSIARYIDLSILGMLFFGIFTEMFKLVYLNFPSKRRDKELPYQGFALGLGIGSIWIVALSYQYFVNHILTTSDFIFASISLVILSIGLSSSHAVGGIWIARGIREDNWQSGVLKASMLQIIFNMTLLPFVWNMHYLYYFWGTFISFPVLYYKVYKGYLLNISKPK